MSSGMPIEPNIEVLPYKVRKAGFRAKTSNTAV
jgi:hypothetical protein